MAAFDLSWCCLALAACWATVTCQSSGYTFQLVNNAKTFDGAKDHCSQIVSGKLAEPRDASLQNSLAAFSTQRNANEAYWIGAKSVDDTILGVKNVAVGSRLWRQFTDAGEEFLWDQGCYRDDNRADFSQTIVESPTSVPSCTARCATQGNQYAAIKWGRDCYCSDTFGSFGPIIQNQKSPSSPFIACDEKCSIDATGIHYCGSRSDFVYSLYKVGGTDMRHHRGSPNNDVNGNQHCARLHLTWPNDPYKLDDLECFDTIPYLCENIASCTGRELETSNKKYCLYNVDKTWYEASNDCVQRGGSLATIYNTTEQVLIGDKLNGSPTALWLDITVHVWFWESDDERLGYYNWDSQRPSSLSSGPKCTTLMANSSNKWSEADCATALPFFCQIDVDECLNQPCPSGSSCVNTDGSYTCQCQTGYTLGSGSTCQDVNECQTSSPCDVNAQCTNNIGSYSCACRGGFYGNGLTCSPVIAECADPTLNDCSAYATCTDLDAGYTCACNSGYAGDGRTCADVNECTSGSDDCADDATCSNTNGGFTCDCNTGYSGSGRVCADIDECQLNTAGCDTNAVCVNIPGSASCTCSVGYTGNGTYCEDVDECQGSNNCDANAVCSNTPGSYECSCRSGFSGDGVTCTAVTAPSAATTAFPLSPSSLSSNGPATDVTRSPQTAGEATTVGVEGPGTAGKSTGGESGLGTAEIVLIVICILLILLIAILFACVIYYKRKNNAKNRVTIDNNYDARPEAPIAYGGNLGDDYYYSGSENGSTSGLVPSRNARAGNLNHYNNSHKQHPKIMVDDEKY